jgi:uncharacterized protein YutE (UPF0331/DUF86 family)
MTPSQLRAKVVAERADWVNRMLTNLRRLPLESYAAFRSDPRNIAAAESYLRRALEALLDLGRHILAKGFGQAITEYKDIAINLVQFSVLNQSKGDLLREVAGYRNRLVHFYHEISDQELYEICTQRLGDVEMLLKAMTDWINSHPEMIDQSI